LAQMSRERAPHILRTNLARQQLLKRSGLTPADAAGHDQIKVPQVRGYVVGKPMRRHPTADVYSDRRQLFRRIPFAHPDPGLPFRAPRTELKICRSPNHCLFELTDIPNHISLDRAEVQNRVANNLSRPVIGNVAAARGLKVFDAFLAQHLLACQQIRALPVAAERNYMRVLAVEQHVLDCAGFAGGNDTLLQFPRRGVTDQSCINHQTTAHKSPMTNRAAAIHYTLICSPRTLANASPIASQTVGCACTMFIKSSIVPSRFNTAAASARISVASGPMM